MVVGHSSLTLDGIGRMRFRLGYDLRRSNDYVLDIRHCVSVGVYAGQARENGG